ncbi:MAG: TlpA disulfide reductase family protein [Capsulimonadales bacterium]|nr:TlpA disulfide reductase family protein [Capsulimonadales bacterium]
MALRIGTELPSLDGATEWQGGSVERDTLTGSPTLVHFWSVSCYICKNNLPTLEEWQKTYGPKGLKVVAIHAPRAEDETDTERVKSVREEFGMTEPCAVDNTFALADRFEIGGLWPHYFLFGNDGKLKSRAAGNAGLTMIGTALKKLLDTPA